MRSMNAADFYTTIEKLSHEIVSGPLQEKLLSQIAKYKAERPNDPPAKHLLVLLTEAADPNLISADHQRAIRDVAFHWV